MVLCHPCSIVMEKEGHLRKVRINAHVAQALTTTTVVAHGETQVEAVS